MRLLNIGPSYQETDLEDKWFMNIYLNVFMNIRMLRRGFSCLSLKDR